jgi:hypothetical protein
VPGSGRGRAAGRHLGRHREGRQSRHTHDRGKDGILRGSVVFYILRDNGNGSHNGDALPSQEMKAVEWDGKKLRFTIADSNGAPAAFVMRLTGDGVAELQAQGGKPDVIAQRRLRR